MKMETQQLPIAKELVSEKTLRHLVSNLSAVFLYHFLAAAGQIDTT
jgi:hypothetical protein